MGRNKQLIPRKKPRQRRSQEMYNVILEATTQLFIQKGYAETTTNHIAQRAGISIGSLYQYFPNKEAIAVELLQRHIVNAPADTRSKIAHFIKHLQDPVEIVRCFIEAALDHHDDNPILHKVLEEEVPHPAHIREALRRNEDLYTTALAHWIGELIPKKASNLNVAARLVFVIIKTMTHWYILNQQTEIKREIFVDEMTEIIMRYLFPSRLS